MTDKEYNRLVEIANQGTDHLSDEELVSKYVQVRYITDRMSQTEIDSVKEKYLNILKNRVRRDLRNE